MNADHFRSYTPAQWWAQRGRSTKLSTYVLKPSMKLGTLDVREQQNFVVYEQICEDKIETCSFFFLITVNIEACCFVWNSNTLPTFRSIQTLTHTHTDPPTLTSWFSAGRINVSTQEQLGLITQYKTLWQTVWRVLVIQVTVITKYVLQWQLNLF